MNEPIKDLGTLLEQINFVPNLKATDKPGVLAELADTAVSCGIIAGEQRNAVLDALVEREGKMSTGMQYGVAIPHAKTELVDRLITMIAISQEGVPFETLDGEPANIFIATLSPPSDSNSHIRFLAAVTRQLANRRVREKVLAAQTRQELVDALTQDGGN